MVQYNAQTKTKTIVFKFNDNPAGLLTGVLTLGDETLARSCQRRVKSEASKLHVRLLLSNM